MNDDGERAHELCEEALVLDQTGDVDGALALWRTAAELGSERAMRNIGVTCMKRGETDDAIVWLRRAATNRNPQAWTSLGAILFNDKGDTVGAAAAWEAGVAAGDSVSAFNLGQLHRQQGDDNEAIQRYQLAADAGEPESMNGLAVLLKNIGRPKFRGTTSPGAGVAAEPVSDHRIETNPREPQAP